MTLYHKLLASDFINKDNFVELLANSNEVFYIYLIFFLFLNLIWCVLKVVLDKDEYAKHPATTNEIKECLKDIKILGKNEIK